MRVLHMHVRTRLMWILVCSSVVHASPREGGREGGRERARETLSGNGVDDGVGGSLIWKQCPNRGCAGRGPVTHMDAATDASLSHPCAHTDCLCAYHITPGWKSDGSQHHAACCACTPPIHEPTPRVRSVHLRQCGSSEEAKTLSWMCSEMHWERGSMRYCGVYV